MLNAMVLLDSGDPLEKAGTTPFQMNGELYVDSTLQVFPEMAIIWAQWNIDCHCGGLTGIQRHTTLLALSIWCCIH